MHKLSDKILPFARSEGGGNLARLLEQAQQSDAPEGEPHYDCTTCRDLGVVTYNVPVGHEWFGKLYPCSSCKRGQEMLAQQWGNRLQSTRMPAQYRACTFETWHQAVLPEQRKGKTLAYEVCKLFATQPKQVVSLATAWKRAGRDLGGELERSSLVLHGPVGVGKTGLMAATINALLESDKLPLWTRAQDLIASVQATYKPDHDGLPTGEIKRLYKTAPILAIDEFQLVQATADRQEIMEDIIRHRYGEQLPTLITCNFGDEELRKQWGERTIDPLKAMAHWIPMGGAPIRNTWQMPDGMEPF